MSEWLASHVAGGLACFRRVLATPNALNIPGHSIAPAKVSTAAAEGIACHPGKGLRPSFSGIYSRMRNVLYSGAGRQCKAARAAHKQRHQPPMSHRASESALVCACGAAVLVQPTLTASRKYPASKTLLLGPPSPLSGGADNSSATAVTTADTLRCHAASAAFAAALRPPDV